MKNNTLPKLTIYDIKRLSEGKSPYFFTRDTLKFFNQKMSDFKVCRYFELGLYHISANMKDNSGKIVGRTVRYFNPETNNLEYIKNDY